MYPMSAFTVEPLGAEPMTLGSPTSPKPGVSAQFLPGFLMGDLPAPVTPQPRPSLGMMEMRAPLLSALNQLQSAAIEQTKIGYDVPAGEDTTLAQRAKTNTIRLVEVFSLKAGVSHLLQLQIGGSPPQPVVPSHKDKSGAPPVRSIYDDITSPGLGATPLSSRKQPSFSIMHTPLSGTIPSTPGTGSSVFSPATIGQTRKATLSPAQLDPFYSQGDTLTSDDQLDDTWVTIFGFPQASASYILLQFAQYGNILKHVMSNTGNWMHVQYQSKLQARKALSKDGRVFGESIMVGVKPCIDKSVMESSDRSSTCSTSSVFTPPVKTIGTPVQPATTPRATTMRPLAAAYKASTSDYQVVADRQTPRKDDSLVSKAMEYMFGW